MDPRDELLAETQRIFAKLADRLTLEQSRECHANMTGFLMLLTKWKNRAEDKTPSVSSAPQPAAIPRPPHSRNKKTNLFARVR